MRCPSITLGHEGLSVSRIVAGMWRMAEWNMPVDARVNFIRACIELGVTTFDHADIYGDYRCEALFGEALTRAPALKHQLQVVSKCGIRLASSQGPESRIKHYDTSAAHIIASAENSLRQLGVEALDLLLIHRPDPLMDYDEMADAFQRLHQAGKVRHFGVSNFTAPQLQALHRRRPLATNQIELSPLHTNPISDGMLDTLQDLGLPPMIWSAMAGGRLFSEPSPLQQQLAQQADRLGISPQTLVYAWLLQLPSRPVVLTGSQRISIIRDAVAACDLQLQRQDWFAILAAARGHDVA